MIFVRWHHKSNEDQLPLFFAIATKDGSLERCVSTVRYASIFAKKYGTRL